MDENDQINYKSLRRIQQEEKTSSLATKIHENFYQSLSSYIKTIEHSIENEKNPLKLKLFTEEFQNTKKIANNIYELREKKIVQAALATARGAAPDIDNLLDIEKKLYATLVEQIEVSRREIFEVPKESVSKIQSPSPPTIDQEKRTPNTNPIVRVLEDTPEFIGTDEKTYLLRKEDVLSLPHEMIEPLLKKEVVQNVK